MELTKNQIAKMYLKLSAQGYASGKEPQVLQSHEHIEVSVLGIPQEMKGFSFMDGKWKYIDSYETGENGLSWGFTRLLHDNKPILWMSYNGRVVVEACERLKIDPKEITAFLKRALLVSYQQWENGLGAFHSGRGSYYSEQKEKMSQMTYTNYDQNSSIEDFKATEVIRFLTGNSIFLNDAPVLLYHSARGGLLI